MDEIQKDKLLENMMRNLPTLRAKASLSQAQLAEMIGISRQTLVAVETGKRKIAWNTFLSCVLVFHKNPETDSMLKLFEITTDDLEMYLKSSGE